MLNLAAPSKHAGLVKRNICFLKEKIHSICHSLSFERIPALILVCMVMYTVQFVNSFLRKRGLKHCPPSAIMTGLLLHMGLQLKFGSYCQVAEDVTPHNKGLLPVCVGQSLWVGRLEICLAKG
jgi:hypothetical protein